MSAVFNPPFPNEIGICRAKSIHREREREIKEEVEKKRARKKRRECFFKESASMLLRGKWKKCFYVSFWVGVLLCFFEESKREEQFLQT